MKCSRANPWKVEKFKRARAKKKREKDEIEQV